MLFILCFCFVIVLKASQLVLRIYPVKGRMAVNTVHSKEGLTSSNYNSKSLDMLYHCSLLFCYSISSISVYCNGFSRLLGGPGWLLGKTR